MPTYKEETQQYHLDRIKEILAIKPNAGIRTIRNILEKDPEDPLVLDRVYIAKLVKKIKSERIHRFDEQKVTEELSKLEDTTQSVIGQLWRVLLDSAAEAKDRVAAGRAIIEATLKLFDAKLNAGIFERKLGTVEVRHTLSQENKILILNALANYRIINPRAGGNADRIAGGAPRNGTSTSRLETSLSSPLPHS